MGLRDGGKNGEIVHFWELSTWKDWLGVNRDIFIRTLCLIFTYAYFTTISARAGDLFLATNTILLQFWHISSYGIDGFAYAAESLSGIYWGQKNTRAFKQIVKKRCNGVWDFRFQS